MNTPSWGEPIDAVDREILNQLRAALDAADPPPADLDEKVQFALAVGSLREDIGTFERLDGELADTDLDYELMLLTERSSELAGTRGSSTTYTLTFTADGVEMMLRGTRSDDGDSARIDGWIVPPAPSEVRATRADDGRSWNAQVDVRGRFEFAALPPGLYRVWLVSNDADTKAFGTPTFEI